MLSTQMEHCEHGKYVPMLRATGGFNACPARPHRSGRSQAWSVCSAVREFVFRVRRWPWGPWRMMPLGLRGWNLLPRLWWLCHGSVAVDSFFHLWDNQHLQLLSKPREGQQGMCLEPAKWTFNLWFGLGLRSKQNWKKVIQIPVEWNMN